MRPATRQMPPALNPGICMRCRCNEQNRSYFIDTGVSIDYEGVMYLCDKCLEDIVKSSGEFFLKAEVDEMLNVQLNQVNEAAAVVSQRADFYAWVLETTGLDFNHLEKKYYERRIVTPNDELAGEPARTAEPVNTATKRNAALVLGEGSTEPLIFSLPS